MTFLSELKRRNVLRMAVLYVVAAWLIMQVAEVLIALANLPVRVGPLVLAVLAIGFPIALILSWFYELTPEGLTLDNSAEPSEQAAHIGGRRVDFVIIAMLAAAVLMFAWDKWWPEGPMEQSIAVLPFKNLSGDAQQEYFSDGISEEILNLLAQIEPLKVIARTSSFSFKGKDVGIATIAEQLNVSHVLEGSVRRSGDRLRITAQLIDTTDSTRVWSQNYDRELGDIFTIQDEIAAAIVGALRNQVGLEVAAMPQAMATTSTEAHDALLRGRYLIALRTATTIEAAVSEFEKAISFDADYAIAHAELAIAKMLLASYTKLRFDDVAPAAIVHIDIAMSLNPKFAEANAARGFVLWARGNGMAAIPYFEQAIQIRPNYADPYNWIGLILRAHGQYAQAFTYREKAAQIDPLSVLAFHAYADDLIERGRIDEAERQIEKLAALAPCRFAVQRGWVDSLGGQWSKRPLAALEGLLVEPTGWRCRASLAQNLALIGLTEEALRIPEAPQPIVMAILGKTSEAIAALGEELAANPTDIPYEFGILLGSSGDHLRAWPILEAWWKRDGGLVTENSPYAAFQLIVARLANGSEDDVIEIVAAIRDNVRRYRDAGISGLVGQFNSADLEEGVADYYSDRRQRGLALITKAAEDGVFIMPNGGLMPPGVDPDIDAILERQEKHQALQREKFLAIVCNDNPYAKVWQPLAETCQGVVELKHWPWLDTGDSGPGM